MASRALTASDVVSALQEQNVEVAAGQVGQPPSPPGQNYQISVRAIGRLSEPVQFENIILKSNVDGTLVRVHDVGRAELGAEDYGSDLQFNGHDAVGLGITQLSNANALEVDRKAIAELARLSQRFPPGMTYQLAFDTTDAVGESIRDVVSTLFEAIVLVIIVIFIFLQDWRTTVIPSITIPVSLIGTFAFVKLLGFSVNTLTLFGITLATGLVVDDAIVVIENIYRHLEECESPLAAARNGSREIAFTVLSISLSLVAFFPGTTGILFRQFALTIAFSISISAFNALTLTPSLTALLLGRTHVTKNWLFRGVDRVIGAVTDGYTHALRAFLKFEWAAVLLFLVGLAATYWIFQTVPNGFVPDEDQGYFIVAVQSPSGASLDYTKKIGQQVQDIMKQHSEVEGTFAISGFSFGGSAPNRALIFVPLKPYSQRKGDTHNATAIVNRVRGPLLGISGAIVIPFLPPAVQGLGNFGGFQFEVLDQASHSLADVDKVVQQVIREGSARKEKDLTGLFTSYSANDPQFLVTIDREKAKSMHVSLQQITDTLSVYMGSSYVNDFDFNNRSYRVYVQADKQFRARAQDIRQFYVRSDNGGMVPLDNLITIAQATTPQVISHYNLFRSVEIDGSPGPGFSSGQAIAAMQDVSKKVLPQGYAYEWTGYLEELQSGGTAFSCSDLEPWSCLTLSAHYESFVCIHRAAGGSHGAAGRLRAQICRVAERRAPDRTVMLVGLSARII